MKIFAIILAVCFVGALADLTEEERVKLDEYAKACVNETGFYNDQVSNDPAKYWITYGHKLLCYFSCMMKKLDVMNEDGTLNEEVVRKKMSDDLPADKIDAIITKCKDLKGANECETAMSIIKCYDDEKDKLSSTEKSA